MSLPVTPVTRQTYHQVALVLGKAFADEPVSAAIYRNLSPENRARALAVDFSAELGVCLHKGYPIQICDGSKVVAAAVIYPPGAFPLPLIDQWTIMLKSVLGNGWYDVKSWFKWLSAADKFHPTQAHYYLLSIGVDPVYQGKGYGTVLMEHLLTKADAEGVGCYLENASPRNLPFYHRFGFQIMREEQIIGFPTWFMWREPTCHPVRSLA